MEYGFQDTFSVLPLFDLVWMILWDTLAGFVFGQTARSLGIRFSKTFVEIFTNKPGQALNTSLPALQRLPAPSSLLLWVSPCPSSTFGR